MVDQVILGGVIASLLGVVLLHHIRRRKVKGASSMGIIQGNECLESSQNEMLSGSEIATTSTDIIIVGAGVAGSALAYTLGKVTVFVCLVTICRVLSLQLGSC